MWNISFVSRLHPGETFNIVAALPDNVSRLWRITSRSDDLTTDKLLTRAQAIRKESEPEVKAAARKYVGVGFQPETDTTSDSAIGNRDNIVSYKYGGRNNFEREYRG